MTDGWPTEATTRRRRTALVLVVLAVLVPIGLGLVSPLLLGNFDRLSSGFAIVALPGALLGIAAALAAPVRIGPRLTVALVGLASVGTAATFGWSQSLVGMSVTAILLSTTSLLLRPALAWLGTALGGDLDERLARAWRASLLLTSLFATTLLVLNVVQAVTYGALFRGTLGVGASIVVHQVVGGMSSVAGLHLVTCAVRSIRALDGVPSPPLRPRLLRAALAAGAVWGLGGALVSVRGL